MPRVYSKVKPPAKPAVKPAAKVKDKPSVTSQIKTQPKKLPKQKPIPIPPELQVSVGGKPPKKTRRPPQNELAGDRFITVFKSVHPGSHFAPLDSITLTALLAVVAQTANITLACNRLSLNRQQVYNLRTENEEFRKALNNAMQMGIDAWEDEAARRAFEGFERPIFQQGLHVGSERQFSDTLAVMMLKAAKPEKYREDKTRIEHTLGGGSVRNAYADKTDDEVNEILNKKLALLGSVSAARGKSLDTIDV